MFLPTILFLFPHLWLRLGLVVAMIPWTGSGHDPSPPALPFSTVFPLPPPCLSLPRPGRPRSLAPSPFVSLPNCFLSPFSLSLPPHLSPSPFLSLASGRSGSPTIRRRERENSEGGRGGAVAGLSRSEGEGKGRRVGKNVIS